MFVLMQDAFGNDIAGEVAGVRVHLLPDAAGSSQAPAAALPVSAQLCDMTRDGISDFALRVSLYTMAARTQPCVSSHAT